MTEQVIAEVRKNSRDVIRVTLQEYQGRPICSIRVWYEADDGSMRPGRDGINFKTELLPELAEAVLAAAAEAAARQTAAEPLAERRSLSS